jgi:hypothetical protein
VNDLAPIFGVLGGLAGIADTIPYVRDTLRGSTRPHRGSIAGALAAGAVDALDVAMLLYPVYYCLVNAAAAILIHRRRAILRVGSRTRVAYTRASTPASRAC